MEKRTNGMAIGKEFPFPHGCSRVRRFQFLRGMRKHACVRGARQQRTRDLTTDYSRGIDIETNGAAAPVRSGAVWRDVRPTKREETVINGKHSWQ
jgi:hypothetical protein